MKRPGLADGTRGSRPSSSTATPTTNNGLLDGIENWTNIATATAEAGQQTNVATVTGNDVGLTVPDDSPANYFRDVSAIQSAPPQYLPIAADAWLARLIR